MKSLKQIIHLRLLAIATICFALASCGQQESKQKLLPRDTRAAGASILASCLSGTASVTVSGTGFAYNNWTPVTWSFPSGPSVRFEGQYGSFVRPLPTDTFFVGTFSLADTCNTWASIATTVLVKNASANVGTSPTTTDNAAGPYNVVGTDGTVGTAFFNLGYYVYSSTTHAIVINDAIAVWGINGQTTKSTVTNPSSSRTAYIIRILSITPGGTTTAPTAAISFRWHKVL